jgi:hypothetical protein
MTMLRTYITRSYNKANIYNAIILELLVNRGVAQAGQSGVLAPSARALAKPITQ